MEQMRERVRDAVYDAQNRNLGAAGIADAALSLMQPEIDRRVAEERANLESKFRCVVSHATGGSFQDIDASLNEISVRISQFRTQLWEQAKQIGAKEEKANLMERLREPSEAMIEAGFDGFQYLYGDPVTHKDVSQSWQAMLAQFEKEQQP